MDSDQVIFNNRESSMPSKRMRELCAGLTHQKFDSNLRTYIKIGNFSSSVCVSDFIRKIVTYFSKNM
jgi:hypothetical protein